MEEIGRTRKKPISLLMERMHIITKEDGHQKLTKQGGRGGDTAVGIIKKGETK
jgi:hypothetical protein